MARNYLINFNDNVYLTGDGSETGRVCKNIITGADALRFAARSGNSSKAADGATFNEFPINTGAGFDFEIKVPVIDKAIYDLIAAEIAASEIADAPPLEITATAPGVAGFIVFARAFYNPVPIGFESFTGAKYLHAVFRFSTDAS